MSLFNDLRDMQRSIDELSSAMMVPYDVTPDSRTMVTQKKKKGKWSPSLDVKDTDQAIILHAELPGIPKEHIKLSIDGNRLVISGQKKTKKKEEGENWIRKERSYGRFYRAITLPPGVDARQVQANYDHGLLEVVVPKNIEYGKRQIEIGTKSQQQQPTLTSTTGQQPQEQLQQQQPQEQLQQTDLGKKPVEVPITGETKLGQQQSQPVRG